VDLKKGKIMKLEKVTEIGVAVKDLDNATRLFTDILGAEAGEEAVVEKFQMKFRMCRLGKVDFELMAPTSDKGTIADFLSKHGEGLHHIAFAVSDIDQTIEDLKENNVKMILDPAMELKVDNLKDFSGRPFKGNLKLTFSHPKSLFGLLLEFIQYPKEFNLSDIQLNP
jgi:methylmalonyl-CoA epimerase